MSNFHKLTGSDKKVLVNMDKVTSIWQLNASDPTQGSMIEFSNGVRISVQETFRTLSNRLAPRNRNRNTPDPTHTEEDN